MRLVLLFKCIKINYAKKVVKNTNRLINQTINIETKWKKNDKQ